MRTQDGEVDLFDLELVSGGASPPSPACIPLLHRPLIHAHHTPPHPDPITRAQLMKTLWRVAGKRVCLRALLSLLQEFDLCHHGYETDGELSATDPGYPGRYCPKQKVILMNDNIRLYDSESESESEAEAEAEAEVPSPSSVVYPAECVEPTPFIEACRECPPVDAPTPAPTPASNAASTTALGQPSCHSLPPTNTVSSAC